MVICAERCCWVVQVFARKRLKKIILECSVCCIKFGSICVAVLFRLSRTRGIDIWVQCDERTATALNEHDERDDVKIHNIKVYCLHCTDQMQCAVTETLVKLVIQTNRLPRATRARAL